LVFSKLLIAISILYSNFYLNTALASTIIVSSLIYFTYSKFNLDHWPIFIKLTVLSLFVIVVFSIPNQNGNDIIKNPFQKITLSPYNAPQPTFDRPLTFIETPVNFDSPMEVKVATGMSVFKEYLQKTIVPYPMGFYYGYAYITPRSFKEVMPWVMMGVFLFLSLLSLYWIIKKHYILAFGLILYLAGIFQALGIFVPIPGALGDRFLFQPSIGFSILLAYPFYKAIGTKWQKHASFIFIGILIIYGYLTIQRNAQWKDHLTLFRDDIKYLDKSVQAHNLLAIHLNKYSFNEVDQNKRIAMQEEAASHFKRAIEIYPKFSNLHFDLGRTNLLLNKLDEALLAFKEAAKLDTTYSESFNNVAAIYQQKGMNKEAIEYYKRSLEIYKFNPLIYTNLSFIYFQTGDFESSLNISREALTHIPNNIEPYENIGKTFYGMGLKDSSIVYFEKAHQLFPNHPNTIDALARLYTEKKDPRANYFMQLLNQMQSQNR
jgi:tetratricopeptide (TPR) repeat protein